jgi:transposase
MTTNKDKDWRQERRERALVLKKANWPAQRIAFALGVTKGAVSQWFKRLREAGDDPSVLAPKPRPGAPSRLTVAQLAQLPAELNKGAKAFGFSNDVWTNKRVASVIEQVFEVRYHPMHVRRLLKKLGWTPQKPVERAVQRDEVAIVVWRNQTQAELKKTVGAIVTFRLEFAPTVD